VSSFLATWSDDKGRTESRVDDLQSQLDKEPRISASIRSWINDSHEEHEERDESLPSPFDDFQESSEDRNTYDSSKSVSFKLIHSP